MERSARNHRSLALLVCGKTTGKTYAESGDYIDIFTRFLHASLDAVQGPQSSLEKSNHDPHWQFTLDPYDVVKRQEYPTEEKLNDYHGVIITGSPAAAYENVEWVNKLLGFVKHLAEDKPQIKLIEYPRPTPLHGQGSWLGYGRRGCAPLIVDDDDADGANYRRLYWSFLRGDPQHDEGHSFIRISNRHASVQVRCTDSHTLIEERPAG